MAISRITLIGSREITLTEKRLASTIGYRCAQLGIAVYSGEAPGSDTDFVNGAMQYAREVNEPFNGKLMLPWKGFSKRPACSSSAASYRVPGDTEYGMSINTLKSSGVVTWFKSIKEPVKRLYGRNVWQVIDIDDWKFTDAVAYFADTTAKGLPKGGTAIAVNLATHLEIPTFNLRKPEQLAAFIAFMRQNKP